MNDKATIRSLSGLGIIDPASILTIGTAALTTLQQLFPSLFGTSRKKLTDSDWNVLIPGNGRWHNALRNYLKTHIHYDVDATNNIVPFTANFAYENGMTNEQLGKLLDEEAVSGGYSTIPGLPWQNPDVGGTGSFAISTNTMLLIGLGLLAILALKKK